MLVVARRKNETILIDGSIQIEVVNVTKATVRVRLSAPRGKQVIRGFVRKELGAQSEPPNQANSAEVDTLNLTLVSQQVIDLGISISLGVVDADRSRALFFIDAPPGMSVLAGDQKAVGGREQATARQNLLQFMGPAPERCSAGPEKAGENGPTRHGREYGQAALHVLPFPSLPSAKEPTGDSREQSQRPEPTCLKPGRP
jgi:carbon storage regulator CsrA